MNACSRAFLVALARAVLALACVAQCGGAQWFAANTYPGVEGGYVIASTVWDPDGAGPAAPALVAGGNFTIAGTEAVSGLAYWDGAGWHGIGSGQLTGDVTALAVFNGELVAGNNTFSGSGVVRWTGTWWQPTFGPFALPPGYAFDAIAFDVTGGTLGCISTPIRYTVY